MSAEVKHTPAAWEGGTCRVPMWSGMGFPDGFCGKPAFGPQWPKAVLYNRRGYFGNPPYCFGPCCQAHGGPSAEEPIIFQDGTTEQGRPMWCAVLPGFVNLQESAAAFNGDPLLALRELAALSKATAP